MPRLPIPGGDFGSWGTLLNDFLNVAHHPDGTLKGTTIAGIPALRLRQWSSNQRPDIVALTYSWSAPDGGGVFVLDATDTSTPDDGGMVVVDASNNRWKRLVHDNCVRPEYWGADPTGVSDSASAFSAAIAYAGAALDSLHAILLNAGGRYKINSSLAITDKSVSIFSNGSSSVGGDYAGMRPCAILDFSNAPVGTKGLAVTATNPQGVFGFRLSNVDIFRSGDTKGSAGRGLYARGMSHAVINNVSFIGFDQSFELDGVGASRIAAVRNLFANVRCSGALTQVFSLGSAYDNQFWQCLFLPALGADRIFYIGGGAVTSPTPIVPNANTFHGCVFVGDETNTPEIGRITSGFRHTFNDCVFEQAMNYGIVLFYVTDEPSSIINLVAKNCHWDRSGVAVYNAGGYTHWAIDAARVWCSSNTHCFAYDTNSTGRIRDVSVKITNSTVTITGSAAAGIFVTKSRGGILAFNTINCTWNASANSGIDLSATTQKWHVAHNHSLTSFGPANGDGINDNGVGNRLDNNTKA